MSLLPGYWGGRMGRLWAYSPARSGNQVFVGPGISCPMKGSNRRRHSSTWESISQPFLSWISTSRIWPTPSAASRLKTALSLRHNSHRFWTTARMPNPRSGLPPVEDHPFPRLESGWPGRRFPSVHSSISARPSLLAPAGILHLAATWGSRGPRSQQYIDNFSHRHAKTGWCEYLEQWLQRLIPPVCR